MYALLSDKELLRFHKALPLVPPNLLKRENIIGEWSVNKAAITLGFFTDSCKTLNMKK